jgi:hypothetical protein
LPPRIAIEFAPSNPRWIVQPSRLLCTAQPVSAPPSLACESVPPGPIASAVTPPRALDDATYRWLPSIARSTGETIARPCRHGKNGGGPPGDETHVAPGLSASAPAAPRSNAKIVLLVVLATYTLDPSGVIATALGPLSVEPVIGSTVHPAMTVTPR